LGPSEDSGEGSDEVHPDSSGEDSDRLPP
jgi:hypothetical protein